MASNCLARDIGFAPGVGEQAVMADTMKALGQDVEREAPHERVGRECHGALALGAIAAGILVSDGNAGLVV
jgi:hypothetical protein